LFLPLPWVVHNRPKSKAAETSTVDCRNTFTAPAVAGTVADANLATSQVAADSTEQQSSVDPVDSGPMSPTGMRHGIRMVDSSLFIELAVLWITTLFLMSIVLPSLNHVWAMLHRISTNLLMCLSLAYGCWYQWMLPQDDHVDLKVTKIKLS